MILVKIPTRERANKFLDVLKMYNETLKDPNEVHFLFSIDEDDKGTLAVIDKAERICENSLLTIDIGKRVNKVEAINRKINDVKDWDILVIGSDDMIPQVEGWDVVINKDMGLNLDKCLWYNDGHQDRICTMSVIGRDYYNRFNYAYHPDYISLWCDNEFTEVAMMSGRMKKIDRCLFRHEHPVWRKAAKSEIIVDKLFFHNESFFEDDKKTYLIRRANNFEL